MIRRFTFALLLGASTLAGCGGSDHAADAGPDLSLPDAGGCSVPADCDDGLFCNGTATCVMGRCVLVPAIDCDDGIACTRDSCSETTRDCRHAAVDADGDGHGAASCLDRNGQPVGDDCDDRDDARFPGNIEVCDAMNHDEDCDSTTFGSRDVDLDGFQSAQCCNGTNCGNDCSDTNGTVFPGQAESCDGLDNDCDTRVDEGVATSQRPDLDFDGHGDATGSAVMRCPGTPGFSALTDDCNDLDPTRFGGQAELCDGLDNDCDTRIDESPTIVTWYRDADGDGFGAASSGTVEACSMPVGYSIRGTDCDDTDAGRKPGATELCNAVDDDCDGRANASLGTNDTEDDDGDGLADSRCSPAGPDCDDTDPSSGGTAAEVCDGRDNDCDSKIDEGATDRLAYVDADGDGYGSVTAAPMAVCLLPSGYAYASGDCNDGAPGTNPGTTEACDGADQDCDGTVDEGASRACTARANANMACIAGSCEVGSCAPGFANCNFDALDGCEVDARTDNGNCGGCNLTCSGDARTVRSCSAGRCAVAGCSGGYLDCNGLAADGCETNGNLDSNHCGTCTTRCDVDFGVGACVGGSCIVGACAAGYADCDADPATGCEVDLRSSDGDCGYCGNDCTLLTNATATCQASRCVISACSGAAGDCNGISYDGCETDTSMDDLNCGACGNSCYGPHVAIGYCNTGTCVVQNCDFGFEDCDGDPANGCETDTSRAEDCGACGNDCRFDYPNATGVCAAGACALGACATGFENCDGLPGNGCETDTRADETNCGGCGVPCTLSNARAACEGGSCNLLACVGATLDCNGLDADGCEVAYFDDPNNCGACGVTCGAGAFCDHGSCDSIVDAVHGADFTCVLRERGRVVCMGDNALGQLGQDPLVVASSATPLEVVLPAPAVKITAGQGFACALTELASVYCWGQNDLGQLGRPATSYGLPGAVSDPSGYLATGVVDIDAGANFGCALLLDGQLACWGANTAGQLALDPLLVPSTSDPVLIPTSIQRFAAGSDFVCGASFGSVTCWGSNDHGQLGTGPGANVTSLPGAPQYNAPVLVRDISMGEDFTCIARDITEGADESIVCWGRNFEEQVAPGASATSPPVVLAFSFGEPASSVSCSIQGCCATMDSGQIACWGGNASGEAGIGSAAGTVPPATYMTLPAGATALSSKRTMSRTGLLFGAGIGGGFGFGDGSNGQLGSAVSTFVSGPVSLPELGD